MNLIKMILFVIEIGLIVNKMIVYHGQNEIIQLLIIIHLIINGVVVQILIEIFDNPYLSNSNNNSVVQLTVNNDQLVDNFIKHNLLNQNQHEKQQYHFFNQLLHPMLQHNIHVINHYLVLNQAQFELEVNSFTFSYIQN